MEFFGMKEMKDTPTKNRPNYAFISLKEYKNKYYNETLGKFLEEYVTGDDDTNQLPPTGTESGSNVNEQPLQGDGRDKVRMYSGNILQYFLTLEDYCDAVRKGMESEWLKFTKTFFCTSRQTHPSMPIALK